MCEWEIRERRRAKERCITKQDSKPIFVETKQWTCPVTTETEKYSSPLCTTVGFVRLCTGLDADGASNIDRMLHRQRKHQFFGNARIPISIWGRVRKPSTECDLRNRMVSELMTHAKQINRFITGS